MNNEAAAIVAHYLKQLALRSGLRWSPANDADMQRLAVMLGAADEAADSIPPYQPAARTTVVLEPADPRFEAWRQRRDDDEAAVGRMVRNGGGR